MKTILFLSLALAVALTACKTEPTAPEVKPSPTPVVVETPKPLDCKYPEVEFKGACVYYMSRVDVDAEYCKSEGKKFECGNPVWYKLPGCKPDSDGDRGAEGTMYLADLKAIEDMVKAQGATIKVEMKDGSKVQFGVGFGDGVCHEL